MTHCLILLAKIKIFNPSEKFTCFETFNLVVEDVRNQQVWKVGIIRQKATLQVSNTTCNSSMMREIIEE